MATQLTDSSCPFFAAVLDGVNGVTAVARVLTGEIPQLLPNPHRLQIRWRESGLLGQDLHRRGAECDPVVIGEQNIRPTRPRQDPMRCPTLAFDGPADAEQRGERLLCFRRQPVLRWILRRQGRRRSLGRERPRHAPTDRRSIATPAPCTAAVACFRVRPYPVTPGSAAMSATHRPSSSRKYSIASEKPVGDFGINPSCHRFGGPGTFTLWIARYLNKTRSRHSVRRRPV